MTGRERLRSGKSGDRLRSGAEPWLLPVIRTVLFGRVAACSERGARRRFGGRPHSSKNPTFSTRSDGSQRPSSVSASSISHAPERLKDNEESFAHSTSSSRTTPGGTTPATCAGRRSFAARSTPRARRCSTWSGPCRRRCVTSWRPSSKLSYRTPRSSFRGGGRPRTLLTSCGRRPRSWIRLRPNR